ESLFDVCDAHSQAMHEAFAAVYDVGGSFSFKAEVVDRFDAMDADCLVIDYVLLHPRWRGLKLGLFAVGQGGDLLGGGCGLTVAEIWPLDPDAHRSLRVPPSWLSRHDTPEEVREAVVKLRRYYRRMGFERLGRTDWYALPMARRTPTVEELLKP